MTRLVTCGYETGDINEQGLSTNTQGTIVVVNATPAPRLGGAYCLKSPGSGSFGPTGNLKTFTLPAAVSELWIRFGFYFNLAGTGGEFPVLGLLDSAGGAQFCFTYNTGDQFIRAKMGLNGTQVAISSATYALNTWHLFEVRWQASSASAGVVELWMNGNRVINFSGDNTNTANVNVQGVQFGLITNGNSFTGYAAYDDIAINDTSGTLNNGRVGDGRVVLLVPTGAGSSTVLSRGGTDSGANWNQVEEVPPSMTDYVYSATAGDRDLYATSDAPAATTSINVVELLALAANSDTGAGSIGLTVKSGATTNEGGAQTLSSGVGYFRQKYETDPNTSAAWTLAALQALEIGVTVR